MEGGGEGMVAIIQGLEDAGLAVTVVKGRYKDERTLASITPPREKCLPPAKCSMGTSTQADQTKRIAQQVCEDQYTSSYQVHYSTRSLSPSANKSESPVQKPEPSRNGVLVKQSPGSRAVVETPVRDYQTYGKNSPWPGRGIQGAIDSRTSEAFAESLRKYPSRGVNNSCEFIGRLLAYTQDKHALDRSKRSRSPKDKTMDTSNEIKANTKNLQTYTRTRCEKESASTIKNMKLSFSEKHFRKRTGIQPLEKYIKYKDNQLNETYDYLKSSSPAHYARAAEVRYFEDVSRCIRDTLRKIVDDKAVECPQIQSRYSRHLRKHHGRANGQSSCTSTCPNLPSVCRFCEKPLPCVCNIPLSTSISPRVENTAALEEKRVNQLWKEQILNWLQEIPVYANITPKEKEIRGNIIEKLTTALIEIKNDEDFEAQANEIIRKYLNNLPMWTPTMKSEQDFFRNQISDSLMHRLKMLTEGHGKTDEVGLKDNKNVFLEKDNIDTNVLEEPTKVNNLLHRSASKLETMSNLDLQNEFEKEILSWLQDIPELFVGSATGTPENRKLIRNFAKELQDLQYKKLDDETMQAQMHNVVKDWLESMIQKNNVHMNFKVNQMLSKKLMNKLMQTAKYADKTTKRKFSMGGDLNKEYLKQIGYWIQDIPELSNGTKSENQETIQSLATKLQNLLSKDIEDEDKLQDEIFNWLTCEAEKKDIQWDTKTQDQLSNNLAATIRKFHTPIFQSASSFEDSVNEDLEQICNWFKDVPEFVKGSKSENYMMANSLARQLQNLHSEGIDDEERIKKQISNWLSIEIKKSGIMLSHPSQEQLIDKLVAKIKNMLATRRKTKFVGNINKEYLKQISDWLADLPELSEGSEPENEKIIESLATKLQTMWFEGVDDKEKLYNKVFKLLLEETEKVGTKLSTKSHDQLVHKILDKLQRNVRHQISSFEGINQDYLQHIYHWLEDIPELGEDTKSEKQKSIKFLAEKLQDLRSDGVEDEDEMQNLVSNWLVNEIQKESTKLNKKFQDQLVNKLVAKIKNIPPPKRNTKLVDSINEDYIELFYDWLADIPELTKGSEFETQLMIQSLAAQLKNLLSDDVSNTEVYNEISKWLLKESNKKGTILSAKLQYQLANKLAAEIKKILALKFRSSSDKNKGKYKPRKHWGKTNLSNDNTEELLINVIGKSISPSRNSVGLLSRDLRSSKKEIINNVCKENQVEIEPNITDLLRDEEICSNGENAIKKHDFNVLQDVDESDKNLSINLDSTLLSEMTKLTLTQKQMFRDDAEKSILDFIEKNIHNPSTHMKKKIREETAKLALILTDILTNSETIIKEKECIIFEEVSEFLKRLSLKQNDVVSKLIEHIQNLSYKTSTQRKYTSDTDFSCYPKRNGTSIPSQRTDKNYIRRSKEDAKFVAELINAIQRWLIELPIDWTKNKLLVDSMVTELAEEIYERQKYLHIHSHLKPSEEEELEHLKYQVFRCLNKALDESNLLLIMSKVKPLMDDIRNTCIPQISRSASLNSNVSQTTISNFSGALHDEKSKWLGHSTSFLSSDVKEGTALSTTLQQGMHKRSDTSERLKNKSFRDESSLTGLSQGAQDAHSSEFNIENIKRAVMDFFNILPFFQNCNYEEKRLQDILSAELANTLHQLLVDGLETFTIDDCDVLIINEIYNCLKKLPIQSAVKEDDSFLLNIAQQLFEYLKRLQLFRQISVRMSKSIDDRLISKAEDLFSLPLETKTSMEKLCSKSLKEEIKNILQDFTTEFSKQFGLMYTDEKVKQHFKKLLELLSSKTARSRISPDLVANAVFNWSKNIPLQTGKTLNDISNALDNFSKHIQSILSTADALINKNKLQEETMIFLRQLPIQIEKMDEKYLQNLVEQLLSIINESVKTNVNPKLVTKQDNILDNEIKYWCNDLPIAGGSAEEELERVKIMKQNLASKLINKVAELHINPKTCHNDIEYEDRLQDEVDNLLATLSPSPELETNLAVLKRNLIKKIREAKHKIADDLAGQPHKKQLHEVVIKSLPPHDVMTSEDEVSFEDLKNSLADAYIRLYYDALNSQQKIKYKKNIIDEIDKFSNKYLEHHPGVLLDSNKINKDLYTALKNIPVPLDETMQFRAMQKKIKDAISDWIQELPLNEESAAQKLQWDKIIAILANRLYELQKEREIQPELDNINKMENEISKWLKIVPLKPGEDIVNQMTEKLINKLRSIEQSRKDNASLEDDKMYSSQAGHPYNDYSSRFATILSTSSLTANDRADLENIRLRNSARRNKLPNDYRDASVSPIPIDAASQTEVSKGVLETCPIISSHTKPCPEADSKSEVSPKIIVKEYFWGTSNSNLNEFVYRIPCLSSRPSCNINAHTSPSYMKVTCPKTTTISTHNFETLAQVTPGPIATDKSSVQMPNPALRLQLCRPCTQMSQKHPSGMSRPRKSQHVNLSPPSKSPLLPPSQKTIFQSPCPGLQNQIRPTCISGQRAKFLDTGKQIPVQEQSSVPTSAGPCMPTSTAPEALKYFQLPPYAASSQTMKRNKNFPFRQPYIFNKTEGMPVESNNPEVESSRYIHEPVTKLGSLNVFPCPKPCRRPDAKNSGVPKDNSTQITVRLPIKKKWDIPCCRPKIYRIPYENDDEKNNSETVKKKQHMRCGCRDCAGTRSRHRLRGSHHSNCESCESLRHCSKCCGISCPHPSGFYFR